MTDPIPPDAGRVIERIAAKLHIPSSTYRLQLGAHLTFDDVRRMAPYLAGLGIGAAYLSPCLRAKSGSTHGYDLVDHAELSPDLGGAAAFETMAAALLDCGLGVIVDVVPNHMAADPVENLAWRDVLQHGAGAHAADWFDVDWHPVTAALHDKILLPILGDQYGTVLEQGQIRVVFDNGVFEVRYFSHSLPLDPRTVPTLFDGVLDDVGATALEPSDAQELLSILTAFSNLPPQTDRDPLRRQERHRETSVAYERLARLAHHSSAVSAVIEGAVATLAGDPGHPAQFDRLHQLLERQPYRLAYWRTAFDEVNYRRFFDINELAALRMEDRRVFEAAHAAVMALIERGLVTGLRVDHPDGLADPEVYFQWLQSAVWRARARHELANDVSADVDALCAWRDRNCAGNPGHLASRPLFVVAEKIVSSGEAFPSTWAIHGGTGYQFLNDVNGLFIDGSGLHKIERFWARLTGRSRSFAETAYESRRLVASSSMASEMNMLAHALENIATSDRRTRDFTLNSLRKVLREVIASFPVYRTYVSWRGTSQTDRAHVREAVAWARRRSPTIETSIFDFVERVLTPDDSSADAHCSFAMRVQQLTGPVQAKGLEDTAFYRHAPLIAANEVGGHPGAPALSVDRFHEANTARLGAFPDGMTALSTHDTKLSGDARARLAALSTKPVDWSRTVASWSRLNARHRGTGDQAVDRADEYRVYQALLALWSPEALDAPLPATVPEDVVDRLTQYIVKATREAKERSSWVQPDPIYEETLVAFTRAATRGPGARSFLKQFVPFARRLTLQGAIASLSQLVLQLSSPGVPDVYQGTEDWRLQLVDPDNRAPVDFAPLVARLDALVPWLFRAVSDPPDPTVDGFARDLADRWHDGTVKTWVLTTGLRHRQQDPALFLRGDYLPLRATSPDAPVVALARAIGHRAAAIVASRFAGDGWPTGSTWGQQALLLPMSRPGEVWRERLTGRDIVVEHDQTGAGTVSLANVLSTLPVAWLSRTSAG
jgi:(1->4)-alpha-D-glucan 1-alpha-D-glucosylmutase